MIRCVNKEREEGKRFEDKYINGGKNQIHNQISTGIIKGSNTDLWNHVSRGGRGKEGGGGGVGE